MRIGDDTREMILQSLLGKGGKEAKAIIEDLSRQTKLSVGYIYKLTDPVRLNGRALRRDAGSRRIELAGDALGWLVETTGRYDLPAEDVIELAELNGILKPGELKPSTYNVWLRGGGTSRVRFNTDVRPYTPWEAPAPNVVHHFDTTKFEELHYDPQTDSLTWNPRANRRNSRGEKPVSVWLYSMVDDHSRAKFPSLYRSENQYNHLDFLYRAWTEKEKPTEFPFYGVPRHIYMDLGPVNKSIKVLHALHKLDVHVIPTTPSTAEEYGSRKHGKVENLFKSYGKWLKRLRIRLDEGPLPWAEAEESLYQFALKINNKIHSTTGAPPFARWMTIGRPAHMPSEDLWRLLKHERDARVVDNDLSISINKHLYRLPWKRPFIDWVGQQVEVYWLKDGYEKVFAVRGAVEVELRELATVARPAFHYDREEKEVTTVDEIRRRASARDYTGIKLWATDDRRPATAYLPRKGQSFNDRRISEKSRPDGSPSFAPEIWHEDWRAAAIALMHAGLIEMPITDGDKAWIIGLMAARERISHTELRAALEKYQEQMESENGGRRSEEG